MQKKQGRKSFSSTGTKPRINNVEGKRSTRIQNTILKTIVNELSSNVIRSHIGSTKECGMVLKLERFSNLSGRSFGLGSPIGLEALSLMLSLRVGT